MALSNGVKVWKYTQLPFQSNTWDKLKIHRQTISISGLEKLSS